jgi:hypothetical protein
MKRGQTAIEYLMYFSFFLMIAVAFSAYAYSQSNNELSLRSNDRLKSVVLLVGQSVGDVNTLSKNADYAAVNITIPEMIQGLEIDVQGDSATGLIQGNTTLLSGQEVIYYMNIGEFDVTVTQTDEKDIVQIEG